MYNAGEIDTWLWAMKKTLENIVNNELFLNNIITKEI